MQGSTAASGVVGCALCGATVRPVFTIDGYDIFECRECRHRMTGVPVRGHVSRTYGDPYFLGGGAGYPNYFEEEDLLVERGRRYAEILGSHVDKAGRLLDVGAAAGFNLRGFAAAGWEGVGIEPNKRMAAHARNQLGLEVHSVALEDYSSNEVYDLICLLQVVAHFVDPKRALEACVAFLADDGTILIETWDRHSLTARLFGRRWHEYSPPSVLHWFSTDGLVGVMRELGFEPIAAGRPRRRIAWRHARSLISHKLGGGSAGRVFESASGWISDRWALPYPFDDLRWYLFRHVTE